MGIGGGGMGGCNNVVFSAFLSKPSSLTLANMRDGTLTPILSHVQTCGMARWDSFSCIYKHAGFYAGTSSLALANMWDGT